MTPISGYTPTIGLEIHAELNTKSKMFCGCKNNPEDAPNTNVCPVCMGHPGTLPFVNEEAFLSLLKIGTAVGGTLPEFTEFDRKNYFYPDIPKGYQISQYKYPLVSGGTLGDIELTRIHLEEDTARSAHDQVPGKSIIDYNRAGVPLMELVTEPVIHDAETASAFAKELQLMLRVMGLGNANMEKGEMRVEANISVSKTSEFGTKVEVKNLNSFKAVEAAILHEIKRQVEVLEKGGEVVQETRGWDDNKGTTFSQRKKESSHDYRYFPDPDIPKFGSSHLSEIKSRIAEISINTPSKIRLEFANLGLTREIAEVIIRDSELRNFFFRYIALNPEPAKVKLASNYVASDVASHLSNGTIGSLEDFEVGYFAELIEMVEASEINSRIAKDLLLEIFKEPMSPRTFAKQNSLLQESDEGALIVLVDALISSNKKSVGEYKTGKVNALQFLVGQGMKESRGTANPTVLRKLIEDRINK